jgi:hypothetical protein
MEFTHHSGTNNKEIDICHKVWALGKVRYIADLNEIKLLSTGSALSLTGSRN